MKKTTMQQLIEQLEEQKKAVPAFTYGKGLDYAIKAAKLKLEENELEIETAYVKGGRDFMNNGHLTASYYKDTYQ